MHITVAGKQVDTGEALKTHVREDLTAIARKYFDYAIEANVTFRKDFGGKTGTPFVCDINLKAGRNLFIRGEGEGPDAHRAFEVAAAHLAKRLRRHRRRVNEHARSLAEERATPAIEPEAGRETTLRQPSEEEEATEDREAAAAGTAAPAGNGFDNGTVIAETPTEIHRLTVGEAVMRLDLAQLPVLMFRNRANDALNVVYRRPDGHVGWIDPTAG
jgi:ribosomal subunit interface protein